MADKKQLIYKEDLLDLFTVQAPSMSYNKMFMAVANAPTVDAVEVVHGEWSTIEYDYVGMIALQCSECNQEYWFEDEPPLKIYNYCPNCGAKMDGDGNG